MLDAYEVAAHAVAKHVPKFLQAHSHLLHKGPKPDEPRIVKEQDDSDIEDYDGVRSLRLSAHTLACSAGRTMPHTLVETCRPGSAASMRAHMGCPHFLAQGALAQAIADNPELAASHPELVTKANKVRRFFNISPSVGHTDGNGTDQRCCTGPSRG